MWLPVVLYWTPGDSRTPVVNARVKKAEQNPVMKSRDVITAASRIVKRMIAEAH
jgi:hypothetical protein